MTIRSRQFLPVLAAVALTAAGRAAAAASGCGDLANAYGPFDYRTVPPPNRVIVEQHHFTLQVEMLKSGQSGYLGGDLDYTLRAMPNHARALMSTVRYGQRLKTERIPDMHWSVECYMDRAVRFTPDDPMVRLIYAIYLLPTKRTNDVRTELQAAERYRGDPPTSDLDYNMGLIYLDIGDYDKAMLSAQRAYALGAPFPGLQNRLKQAGKWRDNVQDPAKSEAKVEDAAKSPPASATPDSTPNSASPQNPAADGQRAQ